MFTPLDGVSWPSVLNKSNQPWSFHLIVAYRGGQCRYCVNQLLELEEKIGNFTQRNVSVIAVSADSKDRAKLMVNQLQLLNLRIGYDFKIELAGQLGLYISEANKESEMPLFTEPGIFLISANMTMFTCWLSAYPFARPKWSDVLAGIDAISTNRTPPRGTLAL